MAMRGRVFTLNPAGLMTAQGVGFAAAGAVAELLPAHFVVAAAGACDVVVVLVSGRPFLPGRG